MGVDTPAGGTRDGIAFAAVSSFAVVMYSVPSLWIEALEPLRLALVSSVLAAGLMLVRRLAKKEPFSFDGGRGLALVAFGGLAYASAAWSINPEETRPHAIEILKLVAVYLTMVNVITTWRRLTVFAGALVVASIVTSWHVITTYNRGEGLVEGFRASWLGVYADPNHMAMNLGLIIPLAVAFLVRRQTPWLMRLLCVVAAVMALTSIVYSHSRGGFIGLLVAMAVWMLLEKSRRVSTLFAAGALALGLVLFAPSTFWQRNETVADFSHDASAMGRVYAWEVASRMSVDNPLLGVGLGGFRHAWPLYAPPQATTAYVAHNVYLDVVGELGFIGLILFLIFTGGAAGGAFAATRSREHGWLPNALAAAVCGYVVCNLFSGYTVSAHFYVLFALAACADRILRAEAATSAAPAPVAPRGPVGASRWEGART
jgi:putative inorganic carbon (HCO3(-)) transporter